MDIQCFAPFKYYPGRATGWPAIPGTWVPGLPLATLGTAYGRPKGDSLFSHSPSLGLEKPLEETKRI